jgi:hypothetical protein
MGNKLGSNHSSNVRETVQAALLCPEHVMCSLCSALALLLGHEQGNLHDAALHEPHSPAHHFWSTAAAQGPAQVSSPGQSCKTRTRKHRTQQRQHALPPQHLDQQQLPSSVQLQRPMQLLQQAYGNLLGLLACETLIARIVCPAETTLNTSERQHWQVLHMHDPLYAVYTLLTTWLVCPAQTTPAGRSPSCQQSGHSPRQLQSWQQTAQAWQLLLQPYC